MQAGEPTYLESDYIGVVDCDMEMSISYFVTKTTTKSIKIELIDREENVVFTYVNDNRQVNSATKQIVETVEIGLLENVSAVKIRISLSAANKEGDAINVDDLQLYSINGQTGIDSVGLNCKNISIEGKSLLINSNEDSILDVYTLIGTIVSKNAICKGANRIILSSGLYIIKWGDYSQKVLIP